MPFVSWIRLIWKLTGPHIQWNRHAMLQSISIELFRTMLTIELDGIRYSLRRVGGVSPMPTIAALSASPPPFSFQLSHGSRWATRWLLQCSMHNSWIADSHRLIAKINEFRHIQGSHSAATEITDIFSIEWPKVPYWELSISSNVKTPVDADLSSSVLAICNR